MKRDDSSMFLGYIHPNPRNRQIKPIDDALTDLVTRALKEGIPGVSNYDCPKGSLTEVSFLEGVRFKGSHHVGDGAISDTCDYKLKTGHITNSLLVHYVRFYRKDITENDHGKLKALGEAYGVKVTAEMFSDDYIKKFQISKFIEDGDELEQIEI